MTSFIASCVSRYGNDVLIGSRFPWISQLTFPGNVELLDSATFLSRISTARSMFIIYDSGPWTSMKAWEQENPQPNEIAILLDAEGQITPRYLSAEKSPRIGQLVDLWERWSDARLFSMLIDLVAQAWQITPTDLVKQETWTQTTSHIYGRIVRK